MGELALLLVCQSATQVKERCPLHLTIYSTQESGSKIIRVGELALQLNCCSIQKSRPWASLGSIIELTLDVGATGEQALPLVCCAVALTKERSPPLPFALTTNRG